MPESPPTVYLSFTSRDEAAAQRIASALRAAGIAVQLATEPGEPGVDHCAVILPVVSDNTQSQSTGRFRTEWQRAAQRAAAMRDDANFILPVVIDNTANRDARVPPAFRGRPWSRWEVWSPPDPLVTRVQAMLEKRANEQAAARAAQEAAAAHSAAMRFAQRLGRRLPPWVRRLKLVWIITLVLLPTGWVVRARLQADPDQDRRPVPEAAPPAAPPQTAAPPPGSPRPPSDERVGEPAARTQPANGGGASGASDHLPASTGGFGPAPEFTVTRAAVAAEPGEGSTGEPTWNDALAARRRAQVREGDAGSANDFLERLAAAGPELATQEWSTDAAGLMVGSPAAGSADVDEADSPVPDTEALRREAIGVVCRGVATADNVQEARAVLNSLRAPFQQEPAAVVAAAMVAFWEQDPAAAVAQLDALGALDWLDTPLFVGPVDLLRGVAHAAADEPVAARLAWSRAEAVTRTRLEANPDEPGALIALAEVHALAGNTPEAIAALQDYDDRVSGRPAGPERERAIVWAVLGFYDEEIDEIVARFRERTGEWAGLHNWLRYDPRLATWREQRAGR